MSLAVVGQLSRDVIAGAPPRIGGPPWHAARALRALGVDARLVAKCGEREAVDYRRSLETLDLPFDLVVGKETTAFSFSYTEDGARTMAIDAVGDPWHEDELRLDGIDWVYVAPLLRGEIDVGWVAEGRHVLLDAHGLVRVPEAGPLRLDGDFKHAQLRHVEMLKLADEEAVAAGEVDVPEVIVTHGSRGATVNGVLVEVEPVDAARRATALVSELLR